MPNISLRNRKPYLTCKYLMLNYKQFISYFIKYTVHIIKPIPSPYFKFVTCIPIGCYYMKMKTTIDIYNEFLMQTWIGTSVHMIRDK